MADNLTAICEPNVSQPYRPPWPVTGRAFFYFSLLNEEKLDDIGAQSEPSPRNVEWHKIRLAWRISGPQKCSQNNIF
jgi:hypothetical protein